MLTLHANVHVNIIYIMEKRVIKSLAMHLACDDLANVKAGQIVLVNLAKLT